MENSTNKQERGYNPERNTLDGKPFIAFGEENGRSSRMCENCVHGPNSHTGECKNPEAKKHFGYNTNERMDVVIMVKKENEDEAIINEMTVGKRLEKERGYYCPYFKSRW